MFYATTSKMNRAYNTYKTKPGTSGDGLLKQLILFFQRLNVHKTEVFAVFACTNKYFAVISFRLWSHTGKWLLLCMSTWEDRWCTMLVLALRPKTRKSNEINSFTCLNVYSLIRHQDINAMCLVQHCFYIMLHTFGIMHDLWTKNFIP